MLKSLQKILARIRGESAEEEESRPLGLTEGEVATLKRLHGTDAWEVICRMVDRAATLENERFLNAEGDPEYTRGYIRGVRALPKTIEFVLNQEEQEDERRRQRERRAAADRERARDLATFGTPARRARERRTQSE